MDYGLNAMFKNISVIFYKPKICEDGRHHKTKENVWKRNLYKYKPCYDIPITRR
jgi:hypothetical protein